MLVVKPDLKNLFVVNLVRNGAIALVSVGVVMLGIFLSGFELGLFGSVIGPVALIFFLAVISVVLELSYYHSTFYVFEEDTLRIRNKVFRSDHRIFYDDIDDYRVEMGEWDRYCGSGDIVLDLGGEEIVLKAVPNPEQMVSFLR